MERLTKKHFAEQVCLYGFGWISNGHWMVRQSSVPNGILFDCSPEVVATALGVTNKGFFAPRRFGSEAEPQNGLRAISTAKPLRLTGMLLDRYALGGLRKDSVARLAVSEDGECAAYSDAYCKLLGLVPGAVIYGGNMQGAYSSSDAESVAWCLMPMRFEKEILATQLGAKFLESLK